MKYLLAFVLCFFMATAAVAAPPGHGGPRQHQQQKHKHKHHKHHKHAHHKSIRGPQHRGFEMRGLHRGPRFEMQREMQKHREMQSGPKGKRGPKGLDFAPQHRDPQPHRAPPLV
jgi:hypothetical protein